MEKYNDFDRLLSARIAENAAIRIYKKIGFEQIEDVSISQYTNANEEWRNHDLKINGKCIDVKNTRPTKHPGDPKNIRFADFCIPEFKNDRIHKSEVTIAAIVSEVLTVKEQFLLDMPPIHSNHRYSKPLNNNYPKIIFLGEANLEKIKNVNNFVQSGNRLELPNECSRPNGIRFIPPWMFDYPSLLYEGRDLKTIKIKEVFRRNQHLLFDLKDDHIFLSLIFKKPDFKELGITGWQVDLYKILNKNISEYGHSLPFLFVIILDHFLKMVERVERNDNFEPIIYRKFLFFGNSYSMSLGIFDPLKIIFRLIELLQTIWESSEIKLLYKFNQFKLSKWDILRGKEIGKNQWITILAYCGGCQLYPLLIGPSKVCKNCGQLICPRCHYCSCKMQKTERRRGLKNKHV